MANKKNMIKVSEIDRLIAEEITRLKKIEQIKARLAVVNEELQRLGEDDIDEVKVGGTRNGEEWYEKGVPVRQFEKNGSHLKEEDPNGDTLASPPAEIELSPDEMKTAYGEGDDDTLEVGDDAGMGEEMPETFEEKLAAIGRELDAKLGGAGGMDMGADDDISVDMDAESPAAEPETSDAPETEEPKDDEEDEIEIDEIETPIAEEEVAPEECMDEEKAPINEGVDRLGKKGNPILAKELRRAAYLAGLSDDE